MMAIEQVDFGYANDSYPCDGFIESVWNWTSSCQNLQQPSTCVKYWENKGPSEGISGIGWGWNDTTWHNTSSIASG